MTASELRELAEHIKWYSGQIWSPDDSRKLAVAAELIELVAWAEESGNSIIVGRKEITVRNWVRDVAVGDTIIETLRRAKGVSDG